MNYKASKSSVLLKTGSLLLILFIANCKKPRNGEYTYEETGTKKTYLCESALPCSLAKTTPINTSNSVKIKNKSNSTLYINDVAWNIIGDSVQYIYNGTSTTNGSNIKYAYSYHGKINNKKNISGKFIRVQFLYSFNNTTIDTTIGTFTYSRK